MRWRFYRSGLYISPLAPLGARLHRRHADRAARVGGGFILVPAMIYLLGMSAQVVVGTSLVHDPRSSARRRPWSTPPPRKSVDIVLAGLLLLGGVIGAQYGALLAQKMKPDLLRSPGHHHPARRFAHGARPRLAARRDLHDRICCERAGPSSSAAALGRRAAAARRRQAAAGARRLARRIEIRYSFTGASCCCSARSSIPAGRRRAEPADIAVVLKGPVQPIVVREKQKIAGIWMNVDSNRFRSAPLLRGRLVAPLSQLVDERTAAIYELGLDNLQLSPGGGALPEKERRFEAGLIDLRRAKGSIRGSRTASRSARACSTARGSPSRPGAGRDLHRRDLPDRGRPGDRRRDARDQDREVGFEGFVANAADRIGR
jgi:hypothetical protein